MGLLNKSNVCDIGKADQTETAEKGTGFLRRFFCLFLNNTIEKNNEGRNNK